MRSPGRAPRLVHLVTALALGASLLPLAGLGSAAPVQAAEKIQPRSAVRTLSHEVFGYLPYWQVNARTAASLRYDLVSTIAFFGLPIRRDGNLDRTQPGYRAYTGTTATAITNAAHANGVRVVPTFQLFDSGRLADLRTFLGSGAAQARFIRQALDLLAARRADGASLDFEPMPVSTTAAYLRFVERFRTAMKARFPGAILVNATAVGASPALIRGLARVTDRQFIMAYDYRWTGSPTAGAVAPIGGAPLTVTRTLERFLRYAPANRLILGVPYYGYSWPVASAARAAAVRRDARRFGPVRGVTYAAARDFLRRHPTVKRQSDRATGSAFFTYWDAARRTYRQVWFDDERSLGAKYETAKRAGLAGVGIWALGNDGTYRELWSRLQASFYAPVHRLEVSASARGVRLTPGQRVRVTIEYTVHNAGTVASRGTLTWTVRDARDRRVARGSTSLTVAPGRSATATRRVTLGPAVRLRAGRYGLSVRFVAAGRTHDARATFRQPY